MKELLCNPSYMQVAVAVLFLALIAQGAGKGIGTLLVPLIKKLTGSKEGVTVNVGGAEAAKGHDCRVNPEDCPAHLAEHERSIRNEQNIGKLFAESKELKDVMHSGVQKLSGEIGSMKTEIIKALASKN